MCKNNNFNLMNNSVVQSIQKIITSRQSIICRIEFRLNYNYKVSELV